jgi:heterodisulfide reductase subunit C2
MSNEANHQVVSDTLADPIQRHTGVKIARCYQCGKCSAGCPLAEEMDFPPSLILRMLQTGSPELEEKVLRSYAIWLCVTCETCIARCPMEIDIPKMMDWLRQESLRRGWTNPRARDIIRFHRAFLDSIQVTGRLYEIGMVADYKVRSRHILQDVLLAPKMFIRGKLKPFPEMIQGRPLLAKIFGKTLKREEERP